MPKINLKNFLSILLIAYLAVCGGLVVKSCFFADGKADLVKPITPLTAEVIVDVVDTAGDDENEDKQPAGFTLPILRAEGGSEIAKNSIIGSTYKDTGFKFQLELDPHGAAISSATLSEYNDRDPKDPQPLVLLN